MTSFKVSLPRKQACLHEQGFRLVKVKTRLGYPAVFMCNCNCGFYLNFDPEKYPDGVVYLKEPKKTKRIILSDETKSRKEKMR